MKFLIQLNSESDAVVSNPAHEIEKALTTIITKINNAPDELQSTVLRDTNGNKIGSFLYQPFESWGLYD